MRALPGAQPDLLILEPLSPDTAKIKNKHLVPDVCAGLKMSPMLVALLPPAAPLSGSGHPEGRQPAGSLGATTRLRSLPDNPQVQELLQTIAQATAGQAGAFFVEFPIRYLGSHKD